MTPLIEQIARALSEAKGLSPDALYQHDEWEDWPSDHATRHIDAFTHEARETLFHYAWRHHTKSAQAILPIITAALDARQEQDAAIAEGTLFTTAGNLIATAIRSADHAQ